MSIIDKISFIERVGESANEISDCIKELVSNDSIKDEDVVEILELISLTSDMHGFISKYYGVLANSDEIDELDDVVTKIVSISK